jgi:GntR family transcriptional regulator
MVHLDYRDARPIYTQITDGFQDQIIAGILKPGDKMPSVRDLATQLTINPNTIQRAYRELESQGWIVSVPGKGSFVQGIPQIDPAQTKALLAEFDKLAATLLAMGLSEDELTAHIRKGGTNHA